MCSTLVASGFKQIKHGIRFSAVQPVPLRSEVELRRLGPIIGINKNLRGGTR
jgi:hypothetical protein